MRAIRLSLLMSLVVIAIAAGTSQGDEGPGQLLSPAAAAGNAQATESDNALRQRYVTVDTGLLMAPAGQDVSEARALQLALFDGESVVAVADSIDSPATGRSIWQGRVRGAAGDTQIGSEEGVVTGVATGVATLVVRDGVAAGTIQAGGRHYRLYYGGDGLHVLEEIANTEPMEEHPPIAVQAPADEVPAPGLDNGRSPAADNGSVVDVMVVYTPASRNRYGQAGIESLIDLAVAETNAAYSTSLINTQLALVATAEVSYGESGDMREDLYRLQRKSDGHMDSVHGWRDAYAADAVVLIQEASDYCGIAFLMTSLSNGFEDHAFSVVDSDCATGYYSFGHELGHNMGSTHDRANGNSSLYAYSYGYWAPDYSFRTIMAYNCPGGCVRRRFFSNPDVLYNGIPTGIDYFANPSQAADNARSLNEAKYTVANWRDSATRRPAAPTALAAVAISPSQIDLNWQDNGNTELGFELERRLAGQSWALIADLAPNSTSYSDSGLAADTTYEYRVRAYAEGATSDYSNVASETTPRNPELHIGDLNGGGSVESGSSPANIIWRANVRVLVHNAYHEPVSGATVNGNWGGGTSGSGSCVTAGDGTCGVVKSGLSSGINSVTFSVSGISNGSDPYLSGNNHDQGGDGTSITIAKPVGVIFMPRIKLNS